MRCCCCFFGVDPSNHDATHPTKTHTRLLILVLPLVLTFGDGQQTTGFSIVGKRWDYCLDVSSICWRCFSFGMKNNESFFFFFKNFFRDCLVVGIYLVTACNACKPLSFVGFVVLFYFILPDSSVVVWSHWCSIEKSLIAANPSSFIFYTYVPCTVCTIRIHYGKFYANTWILSWARFSS